MVLVGSGRPLDPARQLAANLGRNDPRRSRMAWRSAGQRWGFLWMLSVAGCAKGGSELDLPKGGETLGDGGADASIDGSYASEGDADIPGEPNPPGDGD